MQPKSPWLTFVLSWLPGLGHLYLGLNKRGLQFMIGFFAIIALIPLLPTVFPFALAILWFYSLFDALQKVALINGYNARYTDSQGGISDLDQGLGPIKVLLEKNTVHPVWIGGLCILVGALLLVRQVFPAVWTLLIRMHVGSLLLALVLIGFGVWLIVVQSRKEQG